MPATTPWHMIHSNSAQQLLEMAFAAGDDAIEQGGGYTFRVVTRAGVEIEGCPNVTEAMKVGYVLAFENGKFVLVSEIAAITVNFVG